MNSPLIPSIPENVQSLYFYNDTRSRHFATKDAIIISPFISPQDLHVFGNPETIAKLIKENAIDFEAILVNSNIADELGEKLISQVGFQIYSTHPELFYTPGSSFQPDDHGILRLNSRNPEHLKLLDNSNITPDLFANENEVAFAMVADNKLVSIARAWIHFDKYYDVGVETDLSYRGKGFATLTVQVLCNYLLSLGFVPIYITGEHNTGSVSVAKKLRMELIATKQFLILK